MVYEPFSSYGNAPDFSWVAFYDFFQRINAVTCDATNFNKFKELLCCGIYDMIQMDTVVVVVENPVKIERNEIGQLHSISGYSIEFGDGWGQHNINGRIIEPGFFKKVVSGNISANDFIHEENEERRAAMYEILGNEKLMELLGASEIDSKSIVHANGDLETLVLYKTKETFPELENNPLAWVKFVCPSTGTNYLISVEPHHVDALDAAVSTSPLFTSKEEYLFTDRS